MNFISKKDIDNKLWGFYPPFSEQYWSKLDSNFSLDVGTQQP